MKVHWLKCKPKRITIWLSILVITIASTVQAQERLLSRKEALIVAESTEEVELFYTMHDGRLKNCIEKEVIKPCESDWVTCVEDAWVVQFTVGAVCPIDHDGRLGITILVDAITGRVISRFPEADYFRARSYCMESYDCLAVQGGDEIMTCENFIFGQIDAKASTASTTCACLNSECRVVEE